MDTPPENTSRFAELAMELFGAKATSEFVKEIWASASSETKQQLADAVIEAMKAHVSKDNWTVGRHVESVLGRFLDDAAKTVVEARADALRAAIVARVEESWHSAVARTSVSVLEKSIEAVRDTVHDALRKLGR
jgi:hypothetical protein